ncbi:MAG TPA: ABC transporter substrate-binding protein [Anaerolineales bacterium]|nr:ABC transporter substrate-binding protein [Anaerolineales bacterium]
MSIKTHKFVRPLLTAIFILLLLNPVPAASAQSPAAPTTVVLFPVSITNTQGSTVGVVASLKAQDQSGTVDTPAKYVLFQTPGKNYQGYRTYNVPASVSPGIITGITVKVNYKGPTKASQAWTWNLYDWVHSTWVKMGDNTGAALNVWKVLNFTATGDVRRFINNSTRQMRLQVVSANALYDAKLDYEAITLSYGVSCSDALGCVLVRSGQPVHIAYLLNVPAFDSLNGALIAVDDAGTIMGHSIQFDGFSRDNCDAAVSQTDANTLLKDASVLAIVGTSCSGEAMAILPSISAAGFSIVSPSNTVASITDPGTAGYLRVSWNDNEQAASGAEYAYNALGLRNAAIIHDDSPYSAGLAQAFETEFVALGGTITGTRQIYQGKNDMRKELGELADGVPEIVYMPVSSPAAGYIVNEARVTTGLKASDGVYLMGSDGLWDLNVVLTTGSDIEGLRLTSMDWRKFSSAYTMTGGYIDKYIAKYGHGKPPDMSWGPFAYDAFNLIKAAIESTAVDAGGGAHLIGRQALRDALYATSGMAGLTGTLTCHPNGECAETPALGVYQYSAGVEQPVWIWSTP